MRPALKSTGWREAVGLVAITLVVVWAYAIFSTTKLVYLFTVNKDTTEYYHSLVDGFIHGRTSMMMRPPATLAALANPYDPQQRAGLEGVLHDATYYKGRYYLYFGAAPVVTLLLPFRLLAGGQFPQGLATVTFCIAGYLASLGLLLAVRRRHFPRCRTGMVWLAALLLGGGNLCLMMLTRNSVWELPIAAAYAFSCAGYWLLFAAIGRRRGRLALLALAGVCFALAIGSRPTFVVCVTALTGFGAWLAWERKWGWSRWREALALLVPVAAGVIALMVYNEVRFGQPLEFGMRYQLGGGDQQHARMSGRAFVPFNFYHYFLAPAQWQRYFPFVEVVGDYPGVRPAGQLGVEDPFGILPNMPFWLLAAVAPFLWARFSRRDPAVRDWMKLWAVGFAAAVAPILIFGGTTNRYMVEFLPALLLLAGLGLLLVGSVKEVRPGRWFRAAAGVAVAATLLFNVLAAFQHNGMFKAHRHDAFVGISRWVNQPVMWWEARFAEAYGPVEVTMKFPRDRPGRIEPVVVTGVAYRSDYLYVYYEPDGRSVKLGYTRTNHEELLSQPIPVDYSEPHRIGLYSGALYPPAGHPFYAEWTDAQVQEAKHTFQITLDGVPYLRGEQDFFDTTPGFVRVGKNDISKYTDPKFTGEILGVSREHRVPAAFTGNAFVRLAVVLPAGAPGSKEPLIATGAPGAGDLLMVQYVDDTHVRLGFEHAGTEPAWSDPLVTVPGEVSLIEASLGSFYPTPQTPEARELAKTLLVKFRGQLVWAQSRGFHPAGGQPPVFGKNALNSPAAGASFTGKIVAAQPMPSPAGHSSGGPFVFRPYLVAAGPEPAYGPVRLTLNLPKGLSATFEPLLVSGPSRERADYLWIRYHDAEHVIIGYEHTGGGGPNGGVTAVDFNRPHVLEIDLPMLYPAADSPYFADFSLVAAAVAKSQARIRWDGATLIDAPVKAYDATPEQVAIGENRLTDTFGRKFTGQIVRWERGTHAPPDGFAQGTGPLELTVSWPEKLPAAGRELILTTGPEGGEDALEINYEPDGRAHFSLREHGGRVVAGESLPIEAGRQQRLQVEWGGFFPDGLRPAGTSAEEWKRRQRACAVSLEGKPVLAAEGDFLLESPQEIGLARTFTGALVGVRRLAADRK